MSILKAVKIEGKDLLLVTIPKGDWEIDGKPIKLDSTTKVEVKDINSIHSLRVTRVVDYYLNGNNEKITVGLYTEKIRNLYAFADEDGYFSDLDKEYEYKKFKQSHQAIYKDIISKSNSYKVELNSITFDTGSEYIKSHYFTNNYNPKLYTYYRLGFVSNIVKTILINKYKFINCNECSYEQTKNKKKFGVHGSFEYWVAFGTYFVPDEYKRISNFIGTLEQCQIKLKEDKDFWELYLQRKYNLMFGKIDQNEFDFKSLINIIKTTANHLQSIESKQKTYEYYRWAKISNNKALNLILDSYKELKNQ